MTSRLTLLTILLFTFNVNAQDLDTVSISGRIVDQNSAVIQGAEVRATLIKTGQTRTTASGADGRYRLIQLEPGTYTVRVSFNGFAPVKMTGRRCSSRLRRAGRADRASRQDAAR